MTGFLNGALPDGFNHTEDFIQLGNTPFAANGLNIVFAPQGGGKSYATANICGLNSEMERVAYLDFDQNSSTFKRYCNSHNVEYVNMSKIPRPSIKAKKDVKWPSELPESLFTIINSLRPDDTIIIDSLSSAFLENSLTIDVAKLLYPLAEVAKQFKLCIVLIDHATLIRNKDGKVVDFKIEGSESGKLKATASACRYIAAHRVNKELGGTFTVTRSRIESVKIDSTFTTGTQRTVNDAVEFIKKKKLGATITKDEFGKATKNKRDNWVKEFIDTIYHQDVIEKTTYLHIRSMFKGRI